MTVQWAQVAVVAAALAAALGTAWWARRSAARRGPAVDVTGLVVGPGVVIFTKDECITCAAALERVEGLGLPVRRVRAEDEPGTLEARGVTGVPVTVVVNQAGGACGRFAGLPARRPLRRAARRARRGAREIPGRGDREL